MRITEFPLGMIPYLAIDRLSTLKQMDRKHGMVPIFDDQWVPWEWKEDLKFGKPTALVYWYPEYVDFLYEIALSGADFRSFLVGFNYENLRWFDLLFTEQAAKLDKLASKTLKLNHLNEATIKNGRFQA